MLRFWAKGRQVNALCDDAGNPLRFYDSGRQHNVEEVVKSWQLEGDWWEEEVARCYYKVTTDTGYLVLMYWDWIEDSWYLQRVYD